MSRGLRSRVAYVLAVWFGCGLVPRAPGTVGTLGAIPLYLALRPYGWPALLAAALFVTGVGVWASGSVARQKQKKDPQIVVIDEVAGCLVTMLAAPATWLGMVVGFVLFRLFDQLKPWPARQAERLPGGWGIVLDDVLAGLWAALVLGALRFLHLL